MCVRVTNLCWVVIFIFPHVNNRGIPNVVVRADGADRSVGLITHTMPGRAVFITHPHNHPDINNMFLSTLAISSLFSVSECTGRV